MTKQGRCLTARGIKAKLKYQHKFKSTYLYGAYSPINGDRFVWEINGVDSLIFSKYLNALSQHNPDEYKIVVIDNAGFHSTKNMSVPSNIYLLRIPPYSPELNPCEQIWQFMKTRFKNQTFENMKMLRKWLHNICNKMDAQLIKSITSNHHYLNAFNENIYS